MAAFRIWAATLLLGAMLFAPRARAVENLLAVLPLDVTNTGGHMTKADRVALEEVLRDEASNALAGWTVLTGDNTIALLEGNGIDPTKCTESSCHLEMARQLEVGRFIGGAVELVDGTYTASIRLMDTKSGRILASMSVAGKTTLELRSAIQNEAPKFFARAGFTGQSPAPKPATTAAALPPSTTAAPAPAANATATVATAPANETIAGRFDLVGETVRDEKTSLTWQRQATAKRAWNDAADYCAGLTLAGGGWRVPTKDELMSLVDISAGEPTINHAAFPGTPADWFWTSTAYDLFPGNAWAILFSEGDSNVNDVVDVEYIRCVR